MSHKSEMRGGEHHIIPSSRGGGGGDNIFPDNCWPNNVDEDHYHWHILFGNMRPDEAMRKIREYKNRDGTLNSRFFTVRFRVSGPWRDKKINPEIKEIKTRKAQKRKDAWRALFGDMKVREVIRWIEREFIYKEWLQSS